ncbi:NAD(P)(+) transhydrogenase (AB-specific) [Parasphaerochaeta coccoides DSM 17374]|uniref:proton-translocating NAD(P)(+) transhydrogenase n=2 Tax=Parasphaerochaeta TaxID=3062336 RepID=F4GIT9_PARC1|nr:NAD(P) transhydrogenase subunit alpha [Parasphaerochaeta coccoides]AEC02707.1 NAD(P)(+) transhydrogenase (AB-specific) [Parasphaerochaeta coccoides DSM 17374]
MYFGIPKENHPGENRVATVPATVTSLCKAGHVVMVEQGAGEKSGFSDAAYAMAGASVVERQEVFRQADILFVVRGGGNNHDESYEKDVALLKKGAFVIGLTEPYAPHPIYESYARAHARVYALELIPRISRAQSMDVLSSMSNLSGYKAALIASDTLPKLMPMLMTSAGTIAPAHAFVLGVGVAGLQAIATLRRLGAVTSAYDVRPAVKDQVHSLGARFIEMKLDTDDSEGSGGYAKELGEDFYRKQRELLSDVLKDSDIVITTAAVPGRKSPVLVTEEMVSLMPWGSVIVDLTAEHGGNCELSQFGKTIMAHGVTIIAPANIVSTVPRNASLLYARNIENFVKNLFDSAGNLAVDRGDEIIDATLVVADGIIRKDTLRISSGAKEGIA